MSSDASPDTGGLAQLHAPPSEPLPLLICVFIHGFKGTDSTFGGFPERLKHILAETIDSATVDCIVFPAYETKGELKAAVEKFADWLANLTVEREVAHGGGAGKARVVLVGHSMGGLLAADTLIALYNSRVDPQAPLWPNIIACIAFDTPYLGLHPGVFANKAEQAISYVQTARDVATTFGLFTTAATSSSKRSSPSVSTDKLITAPPPASAAPPKSSTGGGGWTKWAPALGGALLAAGAAGAAYYRRDDLTQGWGWANDHMKYVGSLWEEKALRARMDALVRTGVRFRVFYTALDAKGSSALRTFCVLPKPGTRDAAFFEPARNRKAQDEVGAHVSMFDPKVNDGYYDLGLRTANIIRDALLADSAVVADSGPAAQADATKQEPQSQPVDLL